MKIETLCLAILSFGEATGYDIRKCAMEGPFDYFLECSYGSIYPDLNRLWQQGFIERRKEARPDHMARLIDTKLTELKHRLNKMREARATCESESVRWVLSYGITIHEAAISFLQQTDRQSQF